MLELGELHAAREGVEAARREVAAASARLATACVTFADLRTEADRWAIEGDVNGGPGRPKAGEFVADEVSLLLREQPWAVRCLIARSRRLATTLPTVWAAFQAGDLDAEQVRIIDRVVRRVAEPHTMTAIDDQVVQAAQTRTPKRLATWLLRLVVQLEPLAFEHRHRRALAERRVTVVQGPDGMGYVTGEVSAADAAAIDAMLAAAARSLGAEDPRSEQQRRADCFADLLLGRLEYDRRGDDETTTDGESQAATESSKTDAHSSDEVPSDWLEVEDVDLETGELLGTSWQQVDADGEPIGEPVDRPTRSTGSLPAWAVRTQRRTLRIGVVVPLSSLLDLDDTPGELADRSACIPAEELRQLIADTLGQGSSRDEVLFTRLLTDDGGRLLDTTELGRFASRRLAEAIMIRAGTCRFPTCNVPADRCDLDHHEAWPEGPTSASNLDPLCRRHHRGKTFAWLASVRDDEAVDWTMPDGQRYRCIDELLPIGAVTTATRGPLVQSWPEKVRA